MDIKIEAGVAEIEVGVEEVAIGVETTIEVGVVAASTREVREAGLKGLTMHVRHCETVNSVVLVD